MSYGTRPFGYPVRPSRGGIEGALATLKEKRGHAIRTGNRFSPGPSANRVKGLVSAKGTPPAGRKPTT